MFHLIKSKYNCKYIFDNWSDIESENYRTYEWCFCRSRKNVNGTMGRKKHPIGIFVVYKKMPTKDRPSNHFSKSQQNNRNTNMIECSISLRSYRTISVDHYANQKNVHKSVHTDLRSDCVKWQIHLSEMTYSKDSILIGKTSS